MVAQQLSIRLLKEGKTPQDEYALADGREDDATLIPPDAKLYTKEFYQETLPWATWLGIEARTSGKRACLFVPVQDRWFVLCFAYGHTLLNQDICVNDFGLLLGLNMLDPTKLKSADMFSPSDNSRQKRVQTTQDSDLAEHEFNGWTNILKSASGKVKTEYQEFAKTIHFSCASISLSTQKSAIELPDLLAELLRIYQLEDYKQTFPEATRITPVKDAILKGSLNDKLFSALQAHDDTVYCIIPELVDYSDIAKFGFNIHRNNRPFYDSVSMGDIYGEATAKNLQFNADTLRTKKLFLYDDNEQEKQSYSLARCLVWDCGYRGRSYHYSHGQWYNIDADFMREVNDKLNARRASAANNLLPFTIPTYSDATDADEAAYNRRLAEQNGAVLLDARNIPMGGYDKIEPCDVLYKKDNNKYYFIHLKHKHGGSSGMAHLFAQGENSLELLINQNQQFINGLKGLMDIDGKRLLPDVEIEAMLNGRYIVSYLIIAEKDKQTPRLPLFSKIALCRTLNSLTSKKQTEAVWDFVPHIA